MKAVFKREVSALFGGLTGWLMLASTPFMLGLVLLMVLSGAGLIAILNADQRQKGKR